MNVLLWVFQAALALPYLAGGASPASWRPAARPT
jgi:hypothetical protein